MPPRRPARRSATPGKGPRARTVKARRPNTPRTSTISNVEVRAGDGSIVSTKADVTITGRSPEATVVVRQGARRIAVLNDVTQVGSSASPQFTGADGTVWTTRRLKVP